MEGFWRKKRISNSNSGFFSLHFKDWGNQTNNASVLANDSLTLVAIFSCSTHLFLFSFHFSFYNVFLCICSLRSSLLHLYLLSLSFSFSPLHPPAGRLLIVNKWALHFSLSIWQQPSFTQCSHMPHWYLRDPLWLQHLLLIYMYTHTHTHKSLEMVASWIIFLLFTHPHTFMVLLNPFWSLKPQSPFVASKRVNTVQYSSSKFCLSKFGVKDFLMILKEVSPILTRAAFVW